jgi:predicted PurR-regulated permease PerM
MKASKTTTPDDQPARPRASAVWSPTTKLIVGLSLVTLLGFLLVRFRDVIGPLLFAFVLAYVLRPLVNAIVERVGLRWGTAVNLIYIVFLALVIGFVAVTGVALYGQIDSLIGVLTEFTNELPRFVAELSSSEEILIVPLTGERIVVGEFIANQNIDLLAIVEQALNFLQPILGQAGGLVGTIATSAFGVIGWSFFIFFSSYFILSDAGQFPDRLAKIDLPGAMDDVERMARELNRTWNAYLRGQVLLSLLVGVIYFVLLLTLGVKNALALALLAGLARFVPYVGQWVTSGTIAVSAFLQSGNHFGMEALGYAVLVTVVVLVMDQIVDSIIGPRIFSSALGVHPAALLVMAIIAASLFGFIGLILAAPVLASVQLFLRYIMRKMVDLNPWPEPEAEDENFLAAIAALPRDGWNRARNALHNLLKRRTPRDDG